MRKGAVCALALWVLLFVAGCSSAQGDPSVTVGTLETDETIVNSDDALIEALIFATPESYNWTAQQVNLEQYLLEDDGVYLFPAIDTETNLLGYINQQGEWAIEPQFYRVSLFEGGLAAVCYDKENVNTYISAYLAYRLHALINQRGEVVYELPKHYSFYSNINLSEGLIPISTRIPQDNSNAASPHIAFINLSGNLAIPPMEVNDSGFSEGLLGINNSEIAGYLNTQGELLIRLQDFTSEHTITLWEFQDGLALIRPDKGGCRYINRQGALEIEQTFEEAHSFSNGVASVKQGGLWGMIDKKGNWVLEPSYEYISTGHKWNNEGLFSAKQNGKWGVIDKAGKWIIEPQFSNMLDFTEGLSPATLEEKDLDIIPWQEDDRIFGYIDMEGNWVIEPQYHLPCLFHNGIAYVVKSVEQNRERRSMADIIEAGYIDRNGNWVWKLESGGDWYFYNNMELPFSIARS